MSQVVDVDWQFAAVIVATFLAGVIAAVMAKYGWRHRERRTGRPFAALMGGVSVWSFTYGGLILSDSLYAMVVFENVGFVGAVVVPVAWFVLALEYAGFGDAITKRTLAALAVEPLVTLGLVWTNGLHGFVYHDLSVIQSGPVTLLALEPTWYYYLNIVYSYLLLAAGMVLLGTVVVRANRLHRKQSLVLIVGACIPLAANATFNLVPELNPVPNYDMTSFAFTLTGICFAVALFRYRLLDLVPVARKRLVERMNDGVLVLAPDGTIVDANPRGRSLLGDGGIGTHVAETPIGDVAGDGGVRTVEIDGESRSFDVSASPVSDVRGTTAGTVVVLRDVTELEILQAHRQRLSVLNRLLRHNVRNEINVIGGRADLLGDAGGDTEKHVRAIERATRRIHSISSRAREVETVIGGHTENDGPVDVATISANVAESVADVHQTAAVEWDGPAHAWIDGIDSEQCELALNALLEESIEQNPNRPARVWVAVETTPDTVRVAVADDGPGIPDLEASVVAPDQDAFMDQGTGLGRWLARWVAEAADGDATVTDNDHDGTTVVLALPRADPPTER